MIWTFSSPKRISVRTRKHRHNVTQQVFEFLKLFGPNYTSISRRRQGIIRLEIFGRRCRYQKCLNELRRSDNFLRTRILSFCMFVSYQRIYWHFLGLTDSAFRMRVGPQSLILYSFSIQTIDALIRTTLFSGFSIRFIVANAFIRIHLFSESAAWNACWAIGRDRTLNMTGLLAPKLSPRRSEMMKSEGYWQCCRTGTGTCQKELVESRSRKLKKIVTVSQHWAVLF
jgi:hypothetical protein